MEENKLFHDRYFLERLLGRGNFSEVWLAKDTKTDIPVALKIYAPATGLDDHGLNVFAREFSLVVNANHKNLLKPLYYDSYERKPYLVLPFCKKGSILKDVGKFTEEQAWHLLRDVASGLAWLHGMNPPVIHQDIKPDNIMVGDNGNYMITDFGVSAHIKSTLRKSMSAAFSSAGTVAYMAPERFGTDNSPIMANDIYSLGATVYEMLTGDTPFGEHGGLLQKKGADVPVLKGNYSNQLKKTISACLQENPWERPTAEQLEIYASTALEGKKIKFAESKSAKIGKFKMFFIAFLTIVLVVIGSIYFRSVGDNNLEVASKQDSTIISINAVNEVVSTTNTLADSIFSAGLDMQKEMVIEIQKKAIKAFETAKEKYEDNENKQKCDLHIQTSQNIIKSLSKSSKNKEKVNDDKELELTDVQDEPVKEEKTSSPSIELSISPTSVNFKGKGGKSTQVAVICNSSWTVESAPAWVKYNVSDNIITIEAEKNSTKEERTGTLIIKSGDKVVHLNIIQARIKTLGIF